MYQEKFNYFKQQKLAENEEKYGQEIREKMTEDRLCKNKAYFFVLKALASASIIRLAIIRN